MPGCLEGRTKVSWVSFELCECDAGSLPRCDADDAFREKVGKGIAYPAYNWAGSNMHASMQGKSVIEEVKGSRSAWFPATQHTSCQDCPINGKQCNQ